MGSPTAQSRCDAISNCQWRFLRLTGLMTVRGIQGELCLAPHERPSCKQARIDRLALRFHCISCAWVMTIVCASGLSCARCFPPQSLGRPPATEFKQTEMSDVLEAWMHSTYSSICHVMALGWSVGVA